MPKRGPTRSVLCAVIVLSAALSVDAPAANSRTYPEAGSGLRIDGVLTSNAQATVVDTQTASGTTSEASLMFQPQLAGSTLLSWLQATLDGYASRKDVQILRVDLMKMTATDSETLEKPFVQEVELPAFDAASAEASKWKLRLSTTRSRATGPLGVVTGMIPPTQQTKWLAGNFRIEIAGIDTSRVLKADPLTVRTTLLPERPIARDAVRLPSTPTRAVAPATSTSTVSNLVLTTPTAGNTLAGFQQWLAGDRAPRVGSISLLTGDLKQTLCTVRLDKLVVTKITTDSTAARARVELTVGGLKLSCP